MRPPIIENGFIKLFAIYKLLLFNFSRVKKIIFSSILISFLLFFIKDPVYSTSFSLYTDYSSDTSSNALSPLLSSFSDLEGSGLDFKLLDYLESDTFLDYIILEEYKSLNNQNLIDFWGVNYNKWSLNPISSLKMVIRNIKYKSGISENEKSIAFTKGVIVEKIKVMQDRETGLYTISVNGHKQSFSDELSNNIYNSILEFSSKINFDKSKEKIDFVESRLLNTEKSLIESEAEMVKFLSENQSLSSPILQLEKTRIQRKINLYGQIYLNLSSELELAKISQKDNTSPLLILDQSVTNSQKSFSFLIRLLIIVVLGFLIYVLFDFYRNRKDLIQ